MKKKYTGLFIAASLISAMVPAVILAEEASGTLPDLPDNKLLAGLSETVSVPKGILLIAAVCAMLLIAAAVAVSRRMYSDKLRKNLDRATMLQESLENYQSAIQSESIVSLEVNLTDNLLVHGLWKNDRGENVPLREILGMDVPCSYDLYINEWRKRFVDSESDEMFGRLTDRMNLLEEFADFKTEKTFDYLAKSITGKKMYLRRNICMIKDSRGDIIAYTTVKDIAEIGRAREQEKSLLEAIAGDFDSVDLIYLDEDQQNDLISLHHKITPSFRAVMTEEWINETNPARRLDLMTARLEPEDRDAFYAETRRGRVYESFARNEVHIVNFSLKVNGETSFFQERFIPIRGHDRQLIGMLDCIRCTDSEIKKELGYRADLECAKQAAEEANRAKTAFLFSMSHDIRTPLNAILGYTALAEKKANDPGTAEYLRKIGVAGDQLLSLVNQVLEMSRVESGRVILQEQRIDMEDVRDTIRTIYSDQAASRDLELCIGDEKLRHVQVIGDADRLTQIINNLIGNAIKYTPEGGRICVNIDELSSDRPDHAVYRFVVEDNGIGMSPEYLPHLFEEFSREENSTVSRIQGTGLGMPIVKKLVDLMQGTIDVESAPGKGAKFTVCIPLRIDAGDNAERKNEKAPVRSLEGMKILLVEDNEMNREIAEEILKEYGAVIDIAKDGVDAVEKVRASSPGDYDVVLMDVQMPRMDGYEATLRIRELDDPRLAGIMIIAMTANAFEEDKRNAFAAGMNGHLSKPIDVQKLVTTLSGLR